jgi:hypothetical protein
VRVVCNQNRCRLVACRKSLTKLTRAQRQLLWEMAHDQRVLFMMRHPRQWMGIRYSINSFPMRTVSGVMVATLAKKGYLRTDKRGYYVLSTKGLLAASIKDVRKRK